MKTLLSLVVAVMFFSSPSLVYSEFNVATVDVARVLTESSVAKEKREKIDDNMAAAKSKIEDKQKDLISLQEKMADSKDPKELDKYDKERKELERYIQDSREDIGRQIDKVGKELTTKVLGIVKSYAQEHNIDMVIDSSEKLRSPVLFREKSVDITESIISLMDK